MLSSARLGGSIRRSALEMARRFCGRRSFFCIWVCVCVAGATCGSCLEGLDVVERAARGLNLGDRRSALETGCVTGAALSSRLTCAHSHSLTLTQAYRLPAQAY